jgi:uroporphyrinogen decarboxylase-like protein
MDILDEKEKKMNTRERFHAIVDFKSFDRLPILEWASWWDKTTDRWHGEGLPVKIQDKYDICRYFDLDIYFQQWYRAIHWDAPKPESHGAGIIKSMEDYENIHKYLFQTGDNGPVDRISLAAQAEIQQTGDAVLWFSLDGFFWLPRTLLGIEDHLYAFYDEPELMHRINKENAEWMVKVIDTICETCVPDFMTFAEDMSYNNGPMLSKELFDEFMKPYYDIVIPHLKERGIRVFIDSDGDVSEPASWFEDAGIEGILPLEAQAGVDIVKLRANHPDMLFLGAFDKMTMPKGEEAMRAEFERLIPVAKKGGFLISCDHQTPPGVSLENYQIYLKLFREFASCP